MSDEDKFLFKCPECERTFRVPASDANRAQCPVCEKAAEREKALRERAMREDLEKEAKQQKHVPGIKNPPRHPVNRPVAVQQWVLLIRFFACVGLAFSPIFMLKTLTAKSVDGVMLLNEFFVLASSLGALALAEMMILAVNVAIDVRTSTVNQAAILQILQSMKKDNSQVD
ncbi:MAG: hypothetical protein WKF77_16320 [Planctomycetaceae bacterium]